MKLKKVVLKGQLVSVMTIKQLAEHCGGRSVITFRKYIVRGILPEANIRSKSKKTSKGETLKGDRLYTQPLAEKLKVVFSGVTQGTEITGEQKRKIALAFQEERQKYT